MISYWLQIGASFMSIERTNLGIEIKINIAEHFRVYSIVLTKHNTQPICSSRKKFYVLFGNILTEPSNK